MSVPAGGIAHAATPLVAADRFAAAFGHRRGGGDFRLLDELPAAEIVEIREGAVLHAALVSERYEADRGAPETHWVMAGVLVEASRRAFAVVLACAYPGFGDLHYLYQSAHEGPDLDATLAVAQRHRQALREHSNRLCRSREHVAFTRDEYLRALPR